MKELKLTIDLLPKGAWNNDLSKTLPKNDWDTLREFGYKKAHGKCQICGFETNELDAHEVWKFDVKNRTQSLENIIAICTKCHGVIHFRNSKRLGYGENAKKHFMEVNKASELEFATHLAEAQIIFEERNSVYYWNMVADLKKFGCKEIEFKNKYRQKIVNPYSEQELSDFKNACNFLPRILKIDINNYSGTITIKCDNINKVEWYNDRGKIKTKYNFAKNFINTFSVDGLDCEKIYFKLSNQYGNLISKNFILEEW